MSHICPSWDPRAMYENEPQARWQHVPSVPALRAKAGQGEPDSSPSPTLQLCFKPMILSFRCPSVLVVLPTLGTSPSHPSPQPQYCIVGLSFLCYATMSPRLSCGELRDSEALECPPPSTPTQPEATQVWFSCHFSHPQI